MTDFFALLNVPRRPWLDPESLKQRFLALSADFHPDRIHGDESQKRAAQDRYTQLNAAYTCLRNPRERLSHLIELERGEKPSELQNVPADLMTLFLEIGDSCRRVDQFLSEKSAATSPLLKVQFFQRGQELSDHLALIRDRLNASRDSLIASVQRLDREWDPMSSTNPSSRSDLLNQLQELRRLLGFFDRWLSQVQERLVQLVL